MEKLTAPGHGAVSIILMHDIHRTSVAAVPRRAGPLGLPGGEAGLPQEGQDGGDPAVLLGFGGQPELAEDRVDVLAD